MSQFEKDGWYIPHPGTLEWIACESFEQAMDKWFEGFNLPRLVTNGEPDTFEEAYQRVKETMTPNLFGEPRECSACTAAWQRHFRAQECRIGKVDGQIQILMREAFFAGVAAGQARKELDQLPKT